MQELSTFALFLGNIIFTTSNQRHANATVIVFATPKFPQLQWKR